MRTKALKTAICLFLLPFFLLARPIQAQNKETERIIFDNGLTLLMSRMNVGVTSIVVLIKSASAEEGRFLGSGISHLCEHMLFNDDPESPKSEIAKKIAALGGTIGGSTSYDWVSYYVSLPKENAVDALKILYPFIFKPSFNINNLQKEKDVIAKEINMGKDDPDRALWNLLTNTVFIKHPYGNPIIGYEPLLRSLSLKDLESYYQNTYIPQKTIVSVAGSFKKEAIVEAVKETFAKESRRLTPTISIPQEPEQITSRTGEERSQLTTLAHAGLAWMSTSIHDRDMFALDVLATILGQGQSSRLNEKLKNKLKLVYSISAGNFTPQYKGVFNVSFLCEEENLTKAKQAILEDIEAIAENGVSEQDLLKAARLVKAEFLFAKQQASEVAISTALFEAMLEKPDFDDEYLKGIESVTSADVSRVIQKYLKENRLNFVSVVPEKAQSLKPAEPESISALKLEMIKLDNGMRVILGKDSRLPVAHITLSFRGGLIDENLKINGISTLVSRLLIKGTEKKSAFEIASFIENLGGNISTFSGNQSFGVSINVLKENVPQALALLYEAVNSPAFSQEETEKEKSILLASLRQQKEDIFTQGSLAIKQHLYSGHALALNSLGNIDSLTGLTRQEIIRFYKQKKDPWDMVLSIFGDINKEEALEAVSPFSFLESVKDKDLTRPKPSTLKETKSVQEALERKQSLYILAFPAVDMYNQDKYALEVLSEVFSGLDGRLFNRIRQELGLSYALGTQNQVLQVAGHFVFYVATTKENLEKTKQAIMKELAAIRKGALKEEEVKNAKRKLIGSERINLQDNALLALRTSIDELLGLGFDNFRRYEQEIKTVTAEDLKRVSQIYLDSPYVEVFISPSK